MREILFRGKRTDNEEWVEGFYLVAAGMAFISAFAVREPVPVIPNTVGQYTGITDKNGDKMFEGDIVESANREKYIIHYQSGAFRLQLGTGLPFLVDELNLEIIGNIHDNPDLLESE